MAAVSLLGTATFDTASGTKTVTATPAVGDLILIVTANSGSTTTTAAPTDNNSSGTYTVVNTSVKATSADTMQIWVRNALIASASSTVFTQAPGTTTGGGMVVLKIPNASVAGSSAIIRSAIQSNQATSTTPAPVLGGTPSTANAIVTAVFNASNTASVTVRSGYTSRANLGYNTPATGLIVATRDNGETSATITWGGTSGSAFSSIAVEVSGATTHASSGAITGPGSTVAGSSTKFGNHASSGALVGPGSAVSGTSTHTGVSVTTHDATGYVEGSIGTLSGTSTHSAPVTHSSSGALVGQGSAVAGTSTRTAAGAAVTHDATGYVEGQIGSVSGTASQSAGGAVTHSSSGALVGPGAAVAGTATKSHPHTSSGALVGPGSTVAGTATRTAITHSSSGALVGPGSSVAGSATKTHPHTSSGAIVGPGSAVSGSATRTGSPTVHTSSGALVGPGSLVSGIASTPAVIASTSLQVLGGGKTRRRTAPRTYQEWLAAQPDAKVEAVLERAAEQQQPEAVVERQVSQAVRAAGAQEVLDAYKAAYVQAWMERYAVMQAIQLKEQQDREEAEVVAAILAML